MEKSKEIKFLQKTIKVGGTKLLPRWVINHPQLFREELEIILKEGNKSPIRVSLKEGHWVVDEEDEISILKEFFNKKDYVNVITDKNKPVRLKIA
jgi:phenolic acid decarboxylase